MPRPLCFVLMPFGKKPDSNGRMIDFDAVYTDVLQPAALAADLEPIRADEEKVGGIIHKPMFERLILCEYAIADLTTANANVFYELGVRHAVKPYTTVPVFAANGARLPFDVAPLRTVHYELGPDGKPARADADRDTLRKILEAARERDVDSPVYQMVEGFPDIQHIKTDVFRTRVDYSTKIKGELEEARSQGAAAVKAVEDTIGKLEDVEAGVLIDLFLSYRDTKAWSDMERVAGAMPAPLERTVLVQEQLGLALNRAGRGEQAERVLQALIASRGPSSETYGILGRVYKDRWDAAKKKGETAKAQGLLGRAVDAYRAGFEADWRDDYPGINAVTLATIKNPPDERATRLLPVVRFAVERKIASGKPDYWDYATLVEVEILGKDEGAANEALGKALALGPKPWEAESTARNLGLIREARESRGEALAWAKAIEDQLAQVGAGAP
jgi:tetratricopeptide (TPR) repeat protein